MTAEDAAAVVVDVAAAAAAAAAADAVAPADAAAEVGYDRSANFWESLMPTTVGGN